MQNLLKKLEELEAIHKTATVYEIASAEQKLNMVFSDEYKVFLEKIGTIIYESYEIYGLGVPENYYLSILDTISALSENDETYPNNAVPLSDIGDGHYYLYDNNSRKIVVWIHHSGISEIIEESLEDFIINLIS